MTLSPPTSDSPTRANDDAVVVFRTERSGVQGRLVRLGAAADTIIRAHNLPEAGSIVLGEALAVTALLGSALSAAGDTLSVQTRTDGAVRIVYADCLVPGQVRGYVRVEEARLTDQAPASRGALLGSGHFAMTHENAATGERYQGVIALDDQSLAASVEDYFAKRENLPTLARLACSAYPTGVSAGANWRAGGLMIQAPAANAQDNEDWSRVRMLAETVETEELLDPALSAERLLIRLFHEEGVTIDKVVPLMPYCKCSRDRVLKVLTSFGPTELANMRDASGQIAATCEFCAKTYAFEMSDIATPPEGGAQ